MTQTLLPLLDASTLTDLFACAPGDVSFTLDNPTDQALHVSLDGKPYVILPHWGRELALKPGRHSLVARGIGSVDFLVFVGSKGGLINPTLSPYVTHHLVQGTPDCAQGFRPPEQEIQLDGVAFHGPFTCSSALFINRNWVYGVHEALPDPSDVGRVRAGRLQGKLYTREVFVAEFEARSGERGRFARERMPEPPTPFRGLGPQVPAPSGPPEWDQALAPLRILCQRYLRAEGVQEQEALRHDYHRVVTELVPYVARTAQGLDTAENMRRSEEQRALYDCFAHSAVPLPK